MRARRSYADPGIGPVVELIGGECCGRLNPRMIGEALAGKSMPPEAPAPAFNKLEDHGAREHGRGPIPTGREAKTAQEFADLSDKVFLLNGIKEIAEQHSNWDQAGGSREADGMGIHCSLDCPC